MDEKRKTIYALASAAGRAGVAVIRLSGALAPDALCQLTGRSLPPPRRAVVRAFHHPRDKVLLDRGLALFFPAPASFTGEDVVELHTHAAPSVIAALLDALAALPALAPAQAGEFTYRAFCSGKLDLTQAEALADLIAADSEAQRRQAVGQLEGGLRRQCEDWRRDLLTLMAQLEAGLDFPDEEDGEQAAQFALAAPLARIAASIKARLADRRGEMLRHGLTAVLTGPPNAGKSTIFNALAGRPAAITSPLAGTTRDIVEVRLDWDSWPVILRDSAGFDADFPAGQSNQPKQISEQMIDAEARRRARAAAASADLRLCVISQDGSPPQVNQRANQITILNKIDLLPPAERARLRRAMPDALQVSAATGENMAALKTACAAACAAIFAGENKRAENGAAGNKAPPVLMTRARHRHLLTRCWQSLESACALAQGGGEAELAAEEVRRAASALGEITGQTGVENVLDEIFSRFCLGK